LQRKKTHKIKERPAQCVGLSAFQLGEQDGPLTQRVSGPNNKRMFSWKRTLIAGLGTLWMGLPPAGASIFQYQPQGSAWAQSIGNDGASGTNTAENSLIPEEPSFGAWTSITRGVIASAGAQGTASWTDLSPSWARLNFGAGIYTDTSGKPPNTGSGTGTVQMLTQITTTNQAPFLFRAYAGGSTAPGEATIADTRAGLIVWVGEGAATQTAGEGTSFSWSTNGITTRLGLTTSCSANSMLLYPNVSGPSEASYEGEIEVNGNTMLHPEAHQINAPVGQTEVQISYPEPQGRTGPASETVVSVDYSPPEGTPCSGVVYAVRTVNYQWGITGPGEWFQVKIIPGFQPKDVVRVGFGTKAIQVYFDATLMPPGVIIPFSTWWTHPSGSAFPVGETEATMIAGITGLSNGQTRTFKVTVLDGSGWGAGAPVELRGDSDGDGQADWRELLAATDPEDAKERFTATASRRGQDVLLSWEGKAGLKYQVESIGPGESTWTATTNQPYQTRRTRTEPLTSTNVGALSSNPNRLYRVAAIP